MTHPLSSPETPFGDADTPSGYERLWQAYKKAADPAPLAQALRDHCPDPNLLPLPSDPDVPEWLAAAAGRSKKLPTFLRQTPLPDVHTLGGRALSPRALLGLIKILQAESQTRHTIATRAVLALLRREDVEALGEEIAACHLERASGAQTEAWGRYQQALTLSEASLVRRGFTPDEWGFTLARLDGIYREVLLRHGSHDAWSILHCLRGYGDRLRSGISMLEDAGHDVEALIQEGRLTPGFGLEFSIDYRKLQWESATEAQSYEETECTFALLRRDPIRPGQPCSAPLEVIVADIEPKVISRFDGKAIARELEEAVRGVKSVRKLVDWLETHGEGTAWSLRGWSRAIEEAWSRLALRGLLYRQPEGPVFAAGPGGTPRDVHGEPVVLDPGRLVWRVQVEALDGGARAGWSARFGAWADGWEAAPRPAAYRLEAPNSSGRLAELRALVYDAPSSEQWSQVVRLLSDWPPDADLAEAVAYIAPKAEGWPLWCEVPARWLVASGLYGQGEDPRLRPCNHWVWRALTPEQLGQLSDKPALAGIRKLTPEPEVPSGKSLPEAYVAPFEDPDLWPAVTHVSLGPFFRLRGKNRQRRFARSGVMQGLDWLEVQRIGATRLIEILSEEGVFVGLRHLKIEAVDDGPFGALMASGDLAGLETLCVDLRGAEQARALASCPWIEGIGALHIGQMWNFAQRGFAEAPFLPKKIERALKSRPSSGHLPPEPF